jgi:hypothetical protein
VGGRCCTSEGVDLGAHWIHGTEGKPITALARRHGLPTVFVGGDSTFTGGWDMLEVHGPGLTTPDDDEKLASVFAADAMWDALEVVRRRTQTLGLADVSLRGADSSLQAEGQLPYDPLTLDWHLELLARDDMGAAVTAFRCCRGTTRRCVRTRRQRDGGRVSGARRGDGPANRCAPEHRCPPHRHSRIGSRIERFIPIRRRHCEWI